MECALDRRAVIGAERTEVLGGTGLWRARELDIGTGASRDALTRTGEETSPPCVCPGSPILQGIDSPAAGLGLEARARDQG